jgi:hypothetical protein
VLRAQPFHSSQSSLKGALTPRKNSDILTAPLNQSTFERRDINVDEGREAKLEKLAEPSTPQLTDTQTDNLKQGSANFLSPHSSAVKMSGFVVTLNLSQNVATVANNLSQKLAVWRAGAIMFSSP